MPDRIIRERACSSPTLKGLSDAGERAFWRGITKADDYGRFDADPEVWLSRCFEGRPTGWTVGKMARALEELESAELIHRYETGNGHVYGHFVRFMEHQRERESKPKFPDPPCGNSPQSAAKCGESRRVEGKPSIGVGAASRGESPLARARSERRESGVERRETNTTTSSWSSFVWGTPEALAELYNTETADACPAVEKLTPARRKKAEQYLRAFPERDFWRQAFQATKQSPFLQGKRNSPGHESFVADFDWFLSVGKNGAENAAKAYEGKYLGQAKASPRS